MKRRHNLNLELGNRLITDIAEKVGSIFGKRGRRIGKTIDDLTKNITIKVDTKSHKNRRDDD